MTKRAVFPPSWVSGCNCIVPDDYSQKLLHYTRYGYRVIGCATKTIPYLTYTQAQSMQREEVESDLTFVGLIIFENKLKPTTTSTIVQLNNAKLRTVMCTGDNILTAISVARECSLVHHSTRIYYPIFIEGTYSPITYVLIS